MRHQPSVYINLCNHNKCIEIVHYPCGHYYIRQYMQWGPVKNYVGRNDRHRITENAGVPVHQVLIGKRPADCELLLRRKRQDCVDGGYRLWCRCGEQQGDGIDRNGQL